MWTALVMGLAGSLHCAGMCSPLAMAITTRKPFLQHKIIYNTGRIFTYALLGAMAAAFGSLFSLTSYQNILSFTIGGLFLLIGVGAISGINVPYFTAGISKFTSQLKGLFSFWLQKKNSLAVFVMGMLNGLLPCGLTYLAMTYCFILPAAQDGFVFMILFGLGTWPVMIGITWLMALGFRKVTLNYQKITTIVFILIGLWMVGRGFVTYSSDTHQHLFGKISTQEVVCP